MKVLCYILGVLIFLFAVGKLFLSLSLTVLQANLWVNVMLIGAIFLCAAGIMGRIEKLPQNPDHKPRAKAGKTVKFE